MKLLSFLLPFCVIFPLCRPLVKLLNYIYRIVLNRLLTIHQCPNGSRLLCLLQCSFAESALRHPGLLIAGHVQWNKSGEKNDEQINHGLHPSPSYCRRIPSISDFEVLKGPLHRVSCTSISCRLLRCRQLRVFLYVPDTACTAMSAYARQTAAAAAAAAENDQSASSVPTMT